MKKKLVLVVFLVLLGALGATAYAIDTAEISGVVISQTGKAVFGAVAYTVIGGEAYGAEVNREGKFRFFIPIYAGATEQFFIAVSQYQQCYGTKMAFVSPNTCQQLNFLCN
jgi:hypothetical protein